VKPAGNHQMKHEPDVVFHPNSDSLSRSAAVRKRDAARPRESVVLDFVA